MEGAVMKAFIALAATLAINVALLGTLQWSAKQAQTAPTGEVSITQLPDAAASYAQLTSVQRRDARAL
jgi:hypothetical protein